jgi:hypothetical protein
VNRVGGVTAVCDRDGCTARHVVPKGDETIWSLEWAGWLVARDPNGRGMNDSLTFCAEHREEAKMVLARG